MCSCRPYEVSSRLKVIATLASSTNAKKTRESSNILKARNGTSLVLHPLPGRVVIVHKPDVNTKRKCSGKINTNGCKISNSNTDITGGAVTF